MPKAAASAPAIQVPEQASHVDGDAPSGDLARSREMGEALARMPFRVELSFESLFRRLEDVTRGNENERCAQARSLVSALEGVPELRGTVDVAQVVETHGDAIRMLLSFVFPELGEDEMPARAYVPFSADTVFSSRSYHAIFDDAEVESTLDESYGEIDYYREHLLHAYDMLFHIHFEVEHTGMGLVKRLRNRRTGLDRFFLLDYGYRYVEARYESLEIPSQKEFTRLLDMQDLAELERRMPLHGVTFSGFSTIRYVEITALHNLSLLKTELVEVDALNSPELFARIVQRLRSILQVSDLDAGLALRYQSMSEHQYCTLRSVIRDFDGCLAGIDETIYGHVIESREPLFVPELTECDCDSAIVAHLRAQGVRSLGLVPLIHGDSVIGVLELTSKQPEALHVSTSRKLADLIAPLTIAVHREMDEVVSRMERAIKAHCTAIHPSVEWRFEDAAYRYLEEQSATGAAVFDDIVFDNVHPLYAAMDIRGSSDNRSRAIQADLVQHLALARSTMARIHQRYAMPIADYYDASLARFEASVGGGLSSGDELTVIEFLRHRVEPFFDYVQEHMPLFEGDAEDDPIAAYRARMDPTLGILYDRRRAYEESVALINDALGELLDTEEQQAQAIFPHYFEKFKTDGVEHSIYVGQSMTRGKRFNTIQLENLRLWQLRVMCEQARLAESLVPQMTVPLRTTPMVLVQSAPITILFRTESKTFEVEGSYNVRYEIIKKRIDKSTIRGTGERLTQPGHLAVIYSQDKEGDEYLRYLEYLREKGFLEGDIERLDLDDLPGVHGLHALRVPIRLG